MEVLRTRHRTWLVPLSMKLRPNSIQYATTTANMFSENSLAMNAPRVFGDAISALHTGTIAFRCPVPMPLISRAQSILDPDQQAGRREECTAPYTPGGVLCRTLKGSPDQDPNTTLISRSAISAAKRTVFPHNYHSFDPPNAGTVINQPGVIIHHAASAPVTQRTCDEAPQQCAHIIHADNTALLCWFGDSDYITLRRSLVSA